MFAHDERKNFSEANETCHRQKAMLADVLSESRTNLLSISILEISSNRSFSSAKNMLATNGTEQSPLQVPMRHAFVGLNESTSIGKFFSSRNHPIECYRYRAWAPKHPS